MRLLLDTHAAIWAISQPRLLPDRIRGLIEEPANQIHVSAASIFEIAIKHRLGKRSAPPLSGTQAVKAFREVGYLLLDILPEHATAVDDLPLAYGDPFDRLLVAQAIVEPMYLVTHDRTIASYVDTAITW
ncbi:MAG: type II toxin-antitoxin system VapC family toxin [Sphingomonadales bacterium]